MTFRITILCDNSVGPISGTLGEHGFAALIEPSDGLPLLFDTGQGLTLLHNAGRMNRDLSQVERIVLSHGHYDHTGGLLTLLDTIGPRQVFAHPGIFMPRNRIKDTGECIPIGIPHTRTQLEAAGARFELSQGHREVSTGVFLTGEVPRVTTFETGDRGLYCDCEGQTIDPIRDDQSLVLDTERGLVVLLGCCHAGLVNTLEHVASVTGRRDVYAVIGGTHLGFCSQEQQEETIATLKRFRISRLAASHCTGFAAAVRLAREFPREYQPAMVGYTLEV